MFDADGDVPNNPSLPVVLINEALTFGDCKPGNGGTRIPNTVSVLSSNGWGGNWVYTVFDYHHFHPNAHEALIVIKGWADIQLGGPGGEVVRVKAGDAMVLPAGTGHCRLSSSPEFSVCGGYPSGQEDYETLQALPGSGDDRADRIAKVSLPVTDPIFGANGPLLDAWCN